MSRSTTAAASLIAIAAALGGCGGGADLRTDRPILRLQLDEYRIVPQGITIKPGRVKFVVRNTGRLTHNLAIEIPPDKPDGTPVLVRRTATMQPGQTAAPI